LKPDRYSFCFRGYYIYERSNDFFQNETSKTMTRLITLFAFLFFTSAAISQNLDSLVVSTGPDSISGKIPTYYSKGKKTIALKLQKLATLVSGYYEKIYGAPFQVKLAVLDSAHWPTGMAPYGIIFYSKGWVFMHSGMSFESFQNVYGMQDFKDVTKKELHNKKISGNDIVNSFLEFYTVHEVGHYYLNALSGAKYPDYFTNEWMASYFALQFFKINRPQILPAFDLFCELYGDNIKPKFTSVKDFNDNFLADGGGIPTYGWYQVNFYFLCKDLWNCAGKSLIPKYKTSFPKSNPVKYNPEEIIEKLGLCSAVLEKFEAKLNATSN